MKSKSSDDILVRCPQCHRLLCKRQAMNDGTKTVYGLHVKHRGMEMWTTPTIAVFSCVGCGNKVRVNSEKGIET